MEKKKRQQLLLKALEEYEFDTQNDLVEHLNENGLKVTQATISRDIKELGVVKVNGQNKKYRYSKFEKEREGANIYKNSVVSIVAAQNIIVLKTVSGTANAVGSFIDNSKIEGVVGSVAGDDNLLIVTSDNESALSVKSVLERLFK